MALALVLMGGSAVAQNASFFEAQIPPGYEQAIGQLVANNPDFGNNAKIRLEQPDAAMIEYVKRSSDFGSGQFPGVVIYDGNRTYTLFHDFSTQQTTGIEGGGQNGLGIVPIEPQTVTLCSGDGCAGSALGTTVQQQPNSCEVKAKCDYGKWDTALNGCFMSAIGLFQPTSGFKTDVETFKPGDFNHTVGVSGLLLGDKGQYLLTADHARGKPPVDFDANGWTHAISNLSGVKDWLYYPFRKVAAKNSNEFPRIVTADGTRLDLMIARIAKGPDQRPGFGHRILKASAAPDLTKIPLLMNVGFGLRPQCGDTDAGTDSGRRRYSPIKVQPCASLNVVGAGAYEFCARTLEFRGIISKSCKVDSGSPVYAVLSDNRRAVVGMMFKVIKDESCSRGNRFVNLTDPAVQQALLDALEEMTGQDRAKLHNEIFLAGDLITSSIDDVFAAFQTLPQHP